LEQQEDTSSTINRLVALEFFPLHIVYDRILSALQEEEWL
jgi:hypothetical protein